jgi:RNA polymerase sigma factor (sigma-70 family)
MRGDDGATTASGEAAVGLVPTFEDVYRSSYRDLTRVAHLLTGSNEVAEEVVQDAFVALYPRFGTIDNPGGYLYRSVVNGGRSWLRRRQTGERIGRAEPPPRMDGLPELDETWAALDRLTPRQRAIVVLRFYADLPLAEIGDLLGCRTGTVKSQLHRALGSLRTVVER